MLVYSYVVEEPLGPISNQSLDRAAASATPIVSPHVDSHPSIVYYE